MTNLDLLDVVHYTQDFRGPGINLIYRAEATGGTLQPGDDAAAVRWFSPTGLPERDEIAFQSHVAALERWCQK